ncbi:MAG: choice-of-anchor J domain-containing protein [Bacteroidia bacterium]|nr:choice-of-anchor J domain-containing protein [Bacteroidia bacterium]
MKKIISILLSCGIIAIAISCVKKEFDEPPVNSIPEGLRKSIKQIREMYQGQAIALTDEMSVYGTITMDDQNGNIYKTAYLQDTSGAISLHFLSSGGVYKGDSVRVYLKGLTLTTYGGAIQLDSVNADRHVIKQATLINRNPELVTIDQIQANITSLESKLIKLENVEFDEGELGQTWADAVNKVSKDRYLKDCNNKEIIVRSSGYANFAAETIPGGKGILIAIVSVYNGTPQLVIREPGELSLDSTRCDGSSPNILILLNKNFEDNSLTSGGWKSKTVTGTISWSVDEYNSSKFAKASSYNSGDASSETWLISPAIDLSSAPSPVLVFESACNYSGPDVELYISTSYDGTSTPNISDWTKLTAVLSTGSWVWQGSGNIDLSSYTVNNVYIGFRYTGTTTVAKTWEIDNIKIKAEN